MPDVQHFYHAGSGTLSYVLSDPSTSSAAIIDPVLEFSVVSGRTDMSSSQALIDFVKQKSLSVEWILETHAHADHLSSAQLLKSALGGKVAIGRGITRVQETFGEIFNLKPPFVADGRQFDHLFDDGEAFNIGDLECRVMATPGHTNDSVTYIVDDAAFIGDTLFNTDAGSARCDFPGGDAGLLYDSIQKLLGLPPHTTLYLCHDYPPESRDVAVGVTVAEQSAKNIHVGKGATREAYVEMRESRDATLPLPRLIIPSVQVNIRAGALPDAEDNDVSYLKIPLNRL
ncbi:MAG: MBL fold metallo-hydrolase [Gammaproteobacteria bacterium]|nr:MBL fold metallo-hydrolase [Gammaproteobacteria bacterium]